MFKSKVNIELKKIVTWTSIEVKKISSEKKNKTIKTKENSREEKSCSPLDTRHLKILLPELDNEKLKELQNLIMSGCNSETCDLSDSKGIDSQIDASEDGKKMRERKI